MHFPNEIWDLIKEYSGYKEIKEERYNGDVWIRRGYFNSQNNLITGDNYIIHPNGQILYHGIFRNGNKIIEYSYYKDGTPSLYINKRENIRIEWSKNGKVSFAGTIEEYKEFMREEFTSMILCTPLRLQHYLE